MASRVPGGDHLAAAAGLHRRSLGDADYGYTSAAKTMTPEEAFALYSTTLAAVLGHIAVADARLAAQIMSGLNTFAFTARFLDGLESPFLSAFEASFGATGQTAVTAAAAERWRSLGQPRTLGGGALQAPLVSAGGVIALVGADDLERALRGATDVVSLHAGIGSLFMSGSQRADLLDDESLEQVGLCVFRAAVGIAGAAEIQTRLGNPPAGDADPLVIPDPTLDPVETVLRETTYQGQPLLKTGPNEQLAQILNGKAIVVELGTLGPSLAERPAAAHAGPPPAIAPSFPAAAGTITGSPFWRNPAVVPVAAVSASGPGVENALQLRSPGLVMSALPRLAPDGRCLLAACSRR